MNTTFAYLVSDGKKVSLTFERPIGVKVGKTNWRQKFTYPIGEAITVYTDDPWVGVIGVYDMSKEIQLLNLVRDVRAHSLSLAERQIENSIHGLFGNAASSEVRGYIWSFDSNEQRNHRWSENGKLLWGVSQTLKSVCFQ